MKKIYCAALSLAAAALILTGCKGSRSKELDNAPDLIVDEEGQVVAQENSSTETGGELEELSEAASESAVIVEVPFTEQEEK